MQTLSNQKVNFSFRTDPRLIARIPPLACGAGDPQGNGYTSRWVKAVAPSTGHVQRVTLADG